jgi:predicted anti-sigma-YlaC factor YlaD
VGCATCRDAVSATLDGEAPGVPLRRVDEHLASCAGCRIWSERAAEVTRRARLTLAPPVPDVTVAVLDRLPAAPARSRRLRADVVLRLALLVLGVGQLALSLPAFGGGGTAGAGHVANETGAWNLGLAVCFLIVAARPALAAGALPFLLPFTLVLAAVTLSDLGAGHVHAGRAVAHLLLVGGALLIGTLALRHRAPRTGPVGRRLFRLPSGSRRTTSADQRTPGVAAAPARTPASARPGGRAAA